MESILGNDSKVHILMAALEEIRDVSAVSEGVDFYYMKASEAIDAVTGEGSYEFDGEIGL